MGGLGLNRASVTRSWKTSPPVFLCHWLSGVHASLVTSPIPNRGRAPYWNRLINFLLSNRPKRFTMRSSLLTLILLSLLSFLTFACTPRTAISTAERPAARDIPVVTYADISSILDRSCSPCHYPARQGRVTPLDNYKAVKKHLATMIRRVELPRDNLEFMPFKMKREALSKDEIRKLKNWAWGGYKKG